MLQLASWSGKERDSDASIAIFLTLLLISRADAEQLVYLT
jgi:hypothetical protein